MKFEFPGYTAVMESLPAGTVVVVYFATPEVFIPTAARVVAPFLNVIVPVGMAKVVEVTVTEKDTDCPNTDGLSDEVIADVVVAT